jgi:hypothetical protein
VYCYSSGVLTLNTGKLSSWGDGSVSQCKDINQLAQQSQYRYRQSKALRKSLRHLPASTINNQESSRIWFTSFCTDIGLRCAALPGRCSGGLATHLVETSKITGTPVTVWPSCPPWATKSSRRGSVALVLEMIREGSFPSSLTSPPKQTCSGYECTGNSLRNMLRL